MSLRKCILFGNAELSVWPCPANADHGVASPAAADVYAMAFAGLACASVGGGVDTMLIDNSMWQGKSINILVSLLYLWIFYLVIHFVFNIPNPSPASAVLILLISYLCRLLLAYHSQHE